MLCNMTTSIGSDAFAFTALLLIALVVLLLLRHFLPLRSTPAYVLVPIFLALFIPLSIILLLPIDLASSLRTEDEATRGVWLPERVILVAWRITYWLTFALTWYLPLASDGIALPLIALSGSSFPFSASTSTRAIELPKTASSTLSDRTLDISSSCLHAPSPDLSTSFCRMDLKAPRSKVWSWPWPTVGA